jgi:hypothetical protein
MVFNLVVGQFMNPLTVNAFVDIGITIEKRILTGDWITLD